ncbi:hypothetical protein GJ604_25420, partial [Escherichia coli]|nr:hypothetical protein [Escherichia coli]
MISELLRRFWAGAVALASLLVTLLLVSKMQKDKGKLEERLEQQKEKLEGKIE